MPGTPISNVGTAAAAAPKAANRARKVSSINMLYATVEAGSDAIKLVLSEARSFDPERRYRWLRRSIGCSRTWETRRAWRVVLCGLYTPYWSAVVLKQERTMDEYVTIVTCKGQITLPAAVRRALGVEQGDRLSVRVTNGAAIIKPAESAIARTAGVVADAAPPTLSGGAP